MEAGATQADPSPLSSKLNVTRVETTDPDGGEIQGQQTQNICIKFIQCSTNVKNVGPPCLLMGGGSRRRLAAAQQTQNICITFVQRWADVVQMLYKCFVFAGKPLLLCHLHHSPII